MLYLGFVVWVYIRLGLYVLLKTNLRDVIVYPDTTLERDRIGYLQAVAWANTTRSTTIEGFMGRETCYNNNTMRGWVFLYGN